MAMSTVVSNQRCIAKSGDVNLGVSIHAANDSNFKKPATSLKEAALYINKVPISWWRMRMLKAQEIRASPKMRWINLIYATGGAYLCAGLFGGLSFGALVLSVLRLTHVFSIVSHFGLSMTLGVCGTLLSACCVGAGLFFNKILPRWEKVEITNKDEGGYIKVPGMFKEYELRDLYIPPRVWQARSQFRVIYPEARFFVEYSEKDPFLIVTDKDGKSPLYIEHWPL